MRPLTKRETMKRRKRASMSSSSKSGCNSQLLVCCSSIIEWFYVNFFSNIVKGGFGCIDLVVVSSVFRAVSF